ncbi:hypothetical protein, partial [Moraxella catarrhalis]|uniref:hypothetical protein n=1 Tax=Moraxella catarrhalis TaxID=480 RepID=UPI00188329AE
MQGLYFYHATASTAYHYANAHHHAIGGDMAGVIIAHFPLIFPIFPIFLGFYNFMLFLANGWIVSTAHHYASTSTNTSHHHTNV